MSYPGAPQILVGQFNAPVYCCAFTNLRGRSLSVDLIRPDSSRLEARPVNLGFGNQYLSDQTMLEGEWVVYVIQDGDLTMEGIYTLQINANPPTLNGQITQAQFRVGAAA